MVFLLFCCFDICLKGECLCPNGSGHSIYEIASTDLNKQMKRWWLSWICSTRTTLHHFAVCVRTTHCRGWCSTMCRSKYRSANLIYRLEQRNKKISTTNWPDQHRHSPRDAPLLPGWSPRPSVRRPCNGSGGGARVPAAALGFRRRLQLRSGEQLAFKENPGKMCLDLWGRPGQGPFGCSNAASRG
jgi:hypothetical protein